MYCIREEDILAWKRYNDLEFIQCACRFTENCTTCDNGGGGSKRQEIKILLRRLKRDNPNIETASSAASTMLPLIPCRAIDPRVWITASWNDSMLWKTTELHPHFCLRRITLCTRYNSKKIPLSLR